MMVRANPFYQPVRQWQIRIFTDRQFVSLVEETFSDLASALLSFETEEDQPEWHVDIITDTQPEKSAIDARLALISGIAKSKTPHYEISVLEKKDWVSEVERSFPPLNIGKFYVYGSHIKTPPPYGKIALKVSAGAAFGSGEHATTSGCLLALGILAKRRRFLHPLDVGCGSGILALAMAKLWRKPVTATDIDPVSIAVSTENSHKNQVHKLIHFAAGDGYNTNLIRRHRKYDVIVANILARPLIKMAPELASNLSDNGVVVLSGLLTRQERMVIAAHKAQGLKLVSRICQNGWSTLILSF